MGLCFGHLFFLLEQPIRIPHDLFLVFLADMVSQHMEEIIQQPGFPASDQFVGGQSLDQLIGRQVSFARWQLGLDGCLPRQADDPDEAPVSPLDSTS